MFDFLGPQVPISKSFFRIPRISATIAGFWPQPERSWWTILRFLVAFSAVTFGAVGENLYGFVHLSNLVGALEAFCPGVTKAISVLKMTLFFIYHKEWCRIVQRMKAMIDEVHDAEKLKIVEGLASIASIFSFVLLASGSSTNASFNMLPLVTNGVRKWQGKETFNVLPFNVILPERFVNYPLYPFTYGVLTLSGAMTVFTFSAVDGFFVCACMYTCGLFRMLQYDIRKTFAILDKCERSSEQQNRQIREELTTIVVRHNAIIDLCSDFTAQFTLIILMHFLSAAFVLCSSILDLMLNSASISIIIYIFYSIAALTQLFLYCIGGNYVVESSLEVASTLYDIEWYKCDVKTRKMVLMMLRRSQKAKTIAVPFFTPSLPAFSSIISTAGSYITLLNTFL